RTTRPTARNLRARKPSNNADCRTTKIRAWRRNITRLPRVRARTGTVQHPFSGKRVAVVMGGLSAEREVSLNTGAGVYKALRDKAWDVVAIDWQEGTSLAQLVEASGAHVVWNALHGTYGEDGAVQGLCACLRVACTGSGILASALAMD